MVNSILHNFLTSLLQAKDMVEFLVLVNQIICKFKSSASAVLEEIFPTIASRLSVILSQDAFSAGPASNTEVMLVCICKQPLCIILYFLDTCSCTTFDISACLYCANASAFGMS